MFKKLHFKQNHQDSDTALRAVEDALQAIHAQPDADPLGLVTLLVAALRPQKHADSDDATRRWQYMNQLLATTPDYRQSNCPSS